MKIIGCFRLEEALFLLAAVFLFARGAPLTTQEPKTENIENAANKSKSEASVNTEEKASKSEPTTTTQAAPKTVVKSPEVAEPPEVKPSGAVQKRSGAPVLDTQMPIDSVQDEANYEEMNPLTNFEGDQNVDGPIKDDDFYLRAILSDPQLVRDIMEEETRLREFQQVPPEMDVDLKPSSMAWYLLATGDIDGVTRMIYALVAYGALNVEEARDYRMAVEEEYAQLTQTGMGGLYPVQAPQKYADEVDYTAALPYPIGIPAFPLPVEFDEAQPEDYQPSLSSYPVSGAEQRLEDEYYYDGVMKELLEAMAQENNLEEELKKGDTLTSEESKEIQASQKSSGTESAKPKSLEDELEGLYQVPEREGSEGVVATAGPPDSDMSVEEQLEQLLGGSRASLGQSNNSANSKQKQDNRTKSQKPLDLKINEKKDNEKKA